MMTTRRYVAEEVGFGGSIHQVSLYVDGGGTKIIRRFTGEGYDANRAAALAYADRMNSVSAQVRGWFKTEVL